MAGSEPRCAAPFKIQNEAEWSPSTRLVKGVHPAGRDKHYASGGYRLRIAVDRHGAATPDVNDNLGIGMGMIGKAIDVGEVPVQAQATALTSWKVDCKRLEKERTVIFHALKQRCK